jgi:hypothetical protein
MSLSKIALFAFALAAVLVGGSINADAARYVGRANGTWSNGATSNIAANAWRMSAEEALFQRAKGVFF